jgi:hypothetical protein
MTSLSLEDLQLARALQMSLGSSTTCPSPAQDMTSQEDDLLLQQALLTSLGLESDTTVHHRPASPSLNETMLTQEDDSQAHLFEEIEAVKRQASSSAKKRRKSAKKLAKRNKKMNTSTFTISASIDNMNEDELRSELRRLCVPFPWPVDKNGLSTLLFSIVNGRIQNKPNSPIRPRSNSKSERKNKKRRANRKKGAGRGQQPLPVPPPAAAPSTKTSMDETSSEELIMKQVMALSLKESRCDSSGASGAGTSSDVTRHLHYKLAMDEQQALERAMQFEKEDYERQQTFAFLAPKVRIEAEQQWSTYMQAFETTGARKPTTDFVVSLAKDIVARQRREAQLQEEENLAAQKLAEEKLLQKRNNETRAERAARFAQAFEARQNKTR